MKTSTSQLFSDAYDSGLNAKKTASYQKLVNACFGLDADESR